MAKIGPYEILETLHLGAQPFYRAKAADGRVVALKTIPIEGLSEEMRERFLREAATCRTLEHTNLVRVFDSGEASGLLYQAMEFLVGMDLGKALAEGRRFTWEEKLSIMEQVSEGLQFAHERKLVHRDIKPANIFLEDSGRVRVVDFGMVRVEESELTKSGTSVGTLNYMAPEQIRGERCTAATDVFSAGIVFYQLASGQHPFSRHDRSLVQVVSAIVFETPLPLSGLCPDAPEGLEFLLNKALEKDAAKRIQTGGDLKQAIVLCRITMKIGATVARPGGGDSGPLTGPEAAAGREAAEDPEKTKAFQRTAAAALPSVKTPVKAEPAAPPGVPSRTTTQSRIAAQFRYCPACTSANPPGATVCRGCGNPLGGAELAAAPAAPKPWGLYLAIGVAALLAIALIVVLIVK